MDRTLVQALHACAPVVLVFLHQVMYAQPYMCTSTTRRNHSLSRAGVYTLYVLALAE